MAALLLLLLLLPLRLCYLLLAATAVRKLFKLQQHLVVLFCALLWPDPVWNVV